MISWFLPISKWGLSACWERGPGNSWCVWKNYVLLPTFESPEPLSELGYVAKGTEVAGGTPCASQLTVRGEENPGFSRWVPHSQEDPGKWKGLQKLGRHPDGRRRRTGPLTYTTVK